MLAEAIARLTAALGNDPFPWQVALLERFLNGEFPDALDVPTGLGKTAVMATGFIARSKPAASCAGVAPAEAVPWSSTPWSLMTPQPLRADQLGTPMPNEALRIEAVTALRGLAEPAIYHIAQASVGPRPGVRGSWRLKRIELDQWADVQPRRTFGGHQGD